MIWLVLPWLVFAVAVGFKIWKLTRLIHHHVSRSPLGIEHFREQLERTWQRGRTVS